MGNSEVKQRLLKQEFRITTPRPEEQREDIEL